MSTLQESALDGDCEMSPRYGSCFDCGRMAMRIRCAVCRQANRRAYQRSYQLARYVEALFRSVR